MLDSFLGWFFYSYIGNHNLLFVWPSLSVFLSNSVLLVSAVKLAGSPSCVVFTVFPSVLASVPRTFFECGRSSFCVEALLSFLLYGSETVGAPGSDFVSFPCPRGGAESFDGRGLSEFSGAREVGSPSCGGD